MTENLIRGVLVVLALEVVVVRSDFLSRGDGRWMTARDLSWLRRQGVVVAPERRLLRRWSRSTELIMLGVYLLLVWWLLIASWHPTVTDSGSGGHAARPLFPGLLWVVVGFLNVAFPLAAGAALLLGLLGFLGRGVTAAFQSHARSHQRGGPMTNNQPDKEK